MDIIQRFLKSSFMKRASRVAKSPANVLAVVTALGKYVRRGGLASVKSDLLTLGGYLRDVATGGYRDYDKGKMLLCVAAVLYVVSPMDFLPDFLFAGLVDDVAVISWIVNHLHEELLRYRAWKEKEQEEAV